MDNHVALLSTVATYKVGNELIFFAENDGGLYVYDYENDICRYLLRETTGEDNNGLLRYTWAGEYEDRLIFIPYNSKKLCVYDKKNRTAEFIDTAGRNQFGTGVFTYGEWVYCLGTGKIARVNSVDYKMEDIPVGGDFAPYSSAYGVGRHIYIGKDEMGVIYDFDLDDHVLRDTKIDNLNEKIRAITEIGGNLWLALSDGSIVEWNLNDNKLENILSTDDRKENEDGYGGSEFINLFKTNNCVYCLPSRGRLLKIDITSRHIETIDELAEFEYSPSMFELKDGIYLYIVLKKGTYIPSRQLVIKNSGEIMERAVLRVDEGTGYQGARMSQENNIYNLERYIENIACN